MDNLFEFLGFQDAIRKAESEKPWYDKAIDIANADNDSFLTTNHTSIFSKNDD